MQKIVDVQPPIQNMVGYLREISGGFEKGQLFYTAVELDIFTLLREPMKAADVSRSLGTSLALTEKVLDVLVSIGLLDHSDGGYSTAASVYQFLVKGEPYYARYLQSSLERRQSWMNLREILLNGPSPVEDKEPQEFKPDREWVDYIARYSMLGRLQATVRIVASKPEFKNARRILDLGGCHGLFAIALAQENQRIEATVFDRPGVTDFTEDYIRAYGMQDRVRTMAGDFMKDDIGSGYDIILGLCSIGGEKEHIYSLYDKVASSLNPGGLFVISDFTLDDDGKGPLLTLSWEIEGLMKGNDFQHLRNVEFSEKLKRHGLCTIDIVDMLGVVDVPMRLIVAKKDGIPTIGALDQDHTS